MSNDLIQRATSIGVTTRLVRWDRTIDANVWNAPTLTMSGWLYTRIVMRTTGPSLWHTFHAWPR